MIQIEGHNDSTLTPVGGLYKEERTMKKKCLHNPYQKTKVDADSKEEELMILMQ
jgi:hypothetical protein